MRQFKNLFERNLDKEDEINARWIEFQDDGGSDREVGLVDAPRLGGVDFRRIVGVHV